MRTATARQLRDQSREVLGWVAAGEEVAISQRGKVIARLVAESSTRARRVDWSTSAAVQMDKTGLPRLSAEGTQALMAGSR